MFGTPMTVFCMKVDPENDVDCRAFTLAHRAALSDCRAPRAIDPAAGKTLLSCRNLAKTDAGNFVFSIIYLRHAFNLRTAKWEQYDRAITAGAQLHRVELRLIGADERINHHNRNHSYGYGPTHPRAHSRAVDYSKSVFEPPPPGVPSLGMTAGRHKRRNRSP
jgi:hypothetical protein